MTIWGWVCIGVYVGGVGSCVYLLTKGDDAEDQPGDDMGWALFALLWPIIAAISLGILVLWLPGKFIGHCIDKADKRRLAKAAIHRASGLQ